MDTPDPISPRLRPWIEARIRFGLNNIQVQMARELALNPRKLGDRVRRATGDPGAVARWIEELYRARFGKDGPEEALSIEERAKLLATRKDGRQKRRRLRKQDEPAAPKDALIPAKAAGAKKVRPRRTPRS